MAQWHTEYMTVTINDPIQYHYIHAYDLGQCLYFLFPKRCCHFVSKFHTGNSNKSPIPANLKERAR